MRDKIIECFVLAVMWIGVMVVAQIIAVALGGQ